jgi:hypothetical protein
LPHPLHNTEVGWPAATTMMAALAVVVVTGRLRGPAMAVTAVDDAAVRWLTHLDGSALPTTMQVVAAAGSWTAITVLLWGLLPTLVIPRRMHNPLVVVIAGGRQGFIPTGSRGRCSPNSSPPSPSPWSASCTRWTGARRPDPVSSTIFRTRIAADPRRGRPDHLTLSTTEALDEMRVVCGACRRSEASTGWLTVAVSEA